MKSPSELYNFIKLGIITFIFILLEYLIVFIEMSIYKTGFTEFNNNQLIINWIIMIIIWLFFIQGIIRLSKRFYGFDLLERRSWIGNISIIAYIVLLVLVVLLGYYINDGLQIIDDFKSISIIGFIIKYIYLFIKAIMISIIISFGQKASSYIENTLFPWGGVFLAATYGVTSLILFTTTKGLNRLLLSITYGLVFIITNKNLKISSILIYIMMILE